MTLTLEDAQQRAFARRAHSAHGVGAAVYRSIGEPGRDGLLLEVVVTDTQRGYGTVEVDVPRARDVDVESVERAVERRAGEYPVADRLAGLVRAETLLLRMDDWKPPSGGA